jgi:hypothetical protein
MFKRKNVSVALAVTSVLLASSSYVSAQQTANGTATVTVQNAFTLANTQSIDFGTLRVTKTGTGALDNANTAFTTLNVDGTQTETSGVNGANATTITVITPGTPGRIDITGAAPFTSLKIDLDTTTPLDQLNAADVNAFEGINEVPLTAAGAGASDRFIMYVSASDTRIEGGTNNGIAYAGDATSGNLRTDGTGAVGLSFGGRLAWDRDSLTSPDDVTYSGNYSITVSY